MIRYAKPATLDEALALLGETSWRVLAGGTDFYPAQGSRPIREDILDINGIGALRGVLEEATHWSIGARTTWTDIIRQPLPSAFDALKQAAREVGSPQIQNAASVAGNLCNASPAADGVPALLVLDAEVELRSAETLRHLPLTDFILGSRRTARRPDELVTAIRIPKTSAAGTSVFVKLGARRYLVISIAMVAVRLIVEDKIIRHAAIAVGACSVVATRLPHLEQVLVGQTLGGPLADIVNTAPMPQLAPIDDVRGSAGYRLDAAREIVARAVQAAACQSPEEVAA
ncbi:MAG TPA: xanthine dehydrogenase family protein subunit M [Mesorhizobium sp.]|uniref:FAD binding domain-containing protein n=1 Tax=Mesorhizobium sp. TaxID=1871066 RepID=UPI002DDD7046|nr:xanthine dehydrogenase family protein subunit M [Mesorhizobium sp.]HEV2505884.1 xanthine dehydrogenase family protein subunit M [Mesorhizobium sp.]